MAKLFWLQPDSSIVEFPLKAEQNVIGRTSRCDVRIKHPGISAEHAVIRVLPGSATLEDLGSTNGTRVNGKKIELHTLRHGDQIGVGRERLMYFAELDEAAKFMQPESIEPFALPAAGGEKVNTGSAGQAAKPAPSNRTAQAGAPTPPSTPLPTLRRDGPTPHVGAAPRGPGPDLDPDLLAALPTGAALVKSRAVTSADAAVALVPAAPRVMPAPSGQLLTASVAVLTGVATGRRYPLNQPSVTLGKEGKQVVEILHASTSRWQIRQIEGVTPAYINGDALVGTHELAAGDVIELTGVRLRFEISLTR